MLVNRRIFGVNLNSRRNRRWLVVLSMPFWRLLSLTSHLTMGDFGNPIWNPTSFSVLLCSLMHSFSGSYFGE